MIEVRVDTSDCQFNIMKIEKIVSEELNKCAIAIERSAKELVPKDTGDLAGSIQHSGGGLTYIIQPNTEYALYIEEGTSPHIITGNPWLYWEELDHPVHQVNHPGNRGYFYMEFAMLLETEDLAETIADALEI